jgi:uncharacterized membrane protein
MSNTLIATIGGLIGLVGWGISDWLAAKSSKKNANFDTNLAMQVPGALIMIGVLLISRQHLPTLEHASIIFLATLCLTGAYLLFIKALSTGDVGVVVPLGNLFPLITLVLSVSFLSVSFSVAQVVCMMIIVVGAVLLAYEKRKKNIPIKLLYRETFLALAAAFFWGLGFFINNIVVSKEPWQINYSIITITMGIIAILIIFITNPSKLIARSKKATKNYEGVIAGTTLTLGSMAVYASAGRSGSLLIPLVIASSAPLVSSSLAAVIDKEHINIIKRAGAVIAIAGIVLLSAA